MPFMSPYRGGYAVCSPLIRGSFEVSQATVDAWVWRCQQSGTNAPVDYAGRRLRPYPELNVASHRPVRPGRGLRRPPRPGRRARRLRAARPACCGPATGSARRSSRASPTTTVCATGETPTTRCATSDGGPPVSPAGTPRATCGGAGGTAGPGRRRRSPPPTGSAYRRFGIEIEFNHDRRTTWATTGARSPPRPGGRARRPAGARTTGTPPSPAGSARTTPPCPAARSSPMSSTAATRRTTRCGRCCAVVRDNGGIAGRAEQGMHVHHDVQRLHAGRQAAPGRQPRKQRRTPSWPSSGSGRRNGNQWCRLAGDYEWQQARLRRRRRAQRDHRPLRRLQPRPHDALRGQARSSGGPWVNTLNGRKVRAWVRLGQAVMQATKDGVTFAPGITTPELVDVLRNHGLTAVGQRIRCCPHRPPGRGLSEPPATRTRHGPGAWHGLLAHHHRKEPP